MKWKISSSTTVVRCDVMLIVLSQGLRVNDKSEHVPATVSINPAEVAEVVRSRSEGWSVIVMRGGREHSVEGTPDEVTAKINGSLK